MKKTVLLLMIVVILSGICLAAGDPNAPPKPAAVAKPAVKAPAIPPMRLRVLPKTAGQAREFEYWKGWYGTSDLTQVYYNIAVLMSIIDNHGATINENRELNRRTLSPSDPNSLASMVVKNRNFVGELIMQNATLKRRVAALENSAAVEIRIEELGIRISDLELKNVKSATEEKEVSEISAPPAAAEPENKMIGEDYGERNDIPAVAGGGEAAGDTAQPGGESADRGDSGSDNPGDGGGNTGRAADSAGPASTDGGT